MIIDVFPTVGLNDILGFTDSFNTNYYCRFCKMKGAMQKQLDQNYNENVNIDLSKTGIKSNCAFHILSKFHV